MAESKLIHHLMKARELTGVDPKLVMVKHFIDLAIVHTSEDHHRKMVEPEPGSIDE